MVYFFTLHLLMKYTDTLFRFPIRVGDDQQIADLHNRYSKGEDVSHIVLETIEGYVRVPVKDITYWEEAYPPETQFSELSKVGFQTTMVVSYRLGEFMCSWPVKKFEEALNTHIDKIEAENPGFKDSLYK